MGLAALGIFILLAFLTFSSADQSLNSWSSEEGVRNLGGRLGAQVADLFFMLFGLAAYLVPGALLFLASNLLRFKELRLRGYKLAAFSGLIFSLSALFAFNFESTTLFGQQVPTGGLIGRGTAQFLRHNLNAFGALLVLLPLLAASIMILCRFSFMLFAGWWLETMRQKWTAWQERQAHRKGEQERDKALAAGKPVPNSGPVIKPQAPPPPPPKPNFFKKEKKKEAAKDKPVQETFDFITQEEGFHTPPLSLLDPPPVSDRRVDKEALAVNARLLEKKLLDFGIDGEVVEIAPGPGDHHVRVRPGAGHQDQQDRRPGRRPDHGLASALDQDRGPDPRQGGGGDRGAQPRPGNGLPAGDLHLRRVPAEPHEVAAGAGQRYRRQPQHDRPGQGAPPAGGRFHRFGQVGLGQHHDPLPPVHRHPAGRALHPGGSQDA